MNLLSCGAIGEGGKVIQKWGDVEAEDLFSLLMASDF